MPDKGNVTIDAGECKGCGLCVKSCTPGVLRLAVYLNHYGYHPAVYDGHGCTGCGLCFFACPEPGAITVYRRSAQEKMGTDSVFRPGGAQNQRVTDCGKGVCPHFFTSPEEEVPHA